MKSQDKLLAVIAVAIAVMVAAVAVSVAWFERGNAQAVESCVNRVPSNLVTTCHSTVWGKN